MTVTAAEAVLEEDLKHPSFTLGVAAGCWVRVTDGHEAFPKLWTVINAADRPGAPTSYLVRWLVDGYINQRPNGAFWDAERNDFLAPAKWPKGKPNTLCASVFKVSQWLHPGKGFYYPWDRLAWERHEAQWNTYVWPGENRIGDFVHLIHRLLNGDEYVGV